METTLILFEIFAKVVLVTIFIAFVTGVAMKFNTIDAALKDLKNWRESFKKFLDETLHVCVECGTFCDGRNVVTDAGRSSSSGTFKRYHCGPHKKPYERVEMDHGNPVYLRRNFDPLALWTRVTEYGAPLNETLKTEPANLCEEESAPSDGKTVNWLDMLDPGDPYKRMEPIILVHPRGTIVCEITMTGDLGTKKARHNTARSLATKLGNRIINAVAHVLLLEE